MALVSRFDRICTTAYFAQYLKQIGLEKKKLPSGYTLWRDFLSEFVGCRLLFGHVRTRFRPKYDRFKFKAKKMRKYSLGGFGRWHCW